MKKYNKMAQTWLTLITSDIKEHNPNEAEIPIPS